MINALAFFGNGADVRSAFNAPCAARARKKSPRLDARVENQIQNENVNERYYYLYCVHLHRK